MKTKEDKSRIQFLIITLFIIGSFTVIFFTNRYGLFPYHTDEWQHLSVVRCIANNHRISVNPYFDSSITDYEIVFHFAGAAIYSIIGQSFIRFYRMFAFVCFSVLLSIIVIFFMKNKNILAGLLTGVILLTIRSNVNVLGFSFFVPMSLGFILLTLEILLKRIKYRMINAIVAIFAYPPIGIMIAAIVAFDSVMDATKGYKKSEGLLKNIREYPSNYAFLAVIGAMVTIVFSVMGMSRAFSAIVFSSHWMQVIVKYNLISLIGISNVILLGFAIFVLISNEKKKDKKTKKRIAKRKENMFYLLNVKNNDYVLSIILRLVKYAFVCAALLILYYVYDISIIVPIPRAIYVFYFVSLFIAGTGLYYIALYSYNITKGMLHHLKKRDMVLVDKVLATTVPIIVVFIFVSLSYFHSYSTFDSMAKYNSFEFNSKTYGIIANLANFTGKGWNGTVIAPPYYSSAIYPITGLRTMAIVPGQLSGGNISLWNDFYQGNCSSKLNDIESLNKSVIILSKSIISCSYLREIFVKSDGKNYFYFYNYSKEK